MSNVYVMGSLVRLIGRFSDLSGVPIDPSVIKLMVIAPNAAAVTYTPTKDTTGVYHFDLAVPNAKASVGRWTYRYEASGSAQGAREAFFDVPASPFYAT